MSLILPFYYLISDMILSKLENFSSFIKKLKKFMRKSFKERYNKNYDSRKISSILPAASFLDPKFKDFKFVIDNHQRNNDID